MVLALISYQKLKESTPDVPQSKSKLLNLKISKPQPNKKQSDGQYIHYQKEITENPVDAHINEIPESEHSFSEDEKTNSLLTGVIAFDRLSFVESTYNDVTSYQFNPDIPQQHPARFIRVNLRDENDDLITHTYTDELGQYEFNVDNYVNRSGYYIEVIAQMRIIDHLNNAIIVNVINQGQLYQDLTNDNNIYHVNSSVFQLFEGNNQRDIHLRTGWHYTLREFEPHMSASQSFAILDTLAKGFTYLDEHEIALPKHAQNLTIHWSQDPDIIEQSTGYYNPSANLIYISGNNAKDTELKPISTISEWNEHTILHEFGHYYLSKIIGRDDTQAGIHTSFGFGSLTLALSEGLANSLAKTILKDWQTKRVSFDIDKKRFVTNTNNIINNDVDNIKRVLINQYGTEYQRPYFNFSPFIEQTVEYFILSIIDPRSEYSLRTTKLNDEIGMNGLHEALLTSTQDPSLLTIYSLADSLKFNIPRYADEIDELGSQLDLTFNDQWGSEQQIIESHIIGKHDELLPDQVQYPFYQRVTVGGRNEISFNGGLQSLSPMRPGTLRYLVLIPPFDSKIKIFIPDVIDDDGYIHKFSFNVLHKGNLIKRSSVSKHRDVMFAYFQAKQEEIYIIRVFDELFDNPNIKSEQTVTTKITISSQ